MQLDGADDQGEVAERLRGIAQLALRGRVPFLTQQADIVAEQEQALEQLDRVLPLPGRAQRVRQPERAGDEQALAALDAIIGLAGLISPDEAAVAQFAADRGDRAQHTRVGGGEESDARDQQQAGVEGGWTRRPG